MKRLDTWDKPETARIHLMPEEFWRLLLRDGFEGTIKEALRE